MQLLIDNFREHTEALKNEYTSNSETLRNMCLENATTKKSFHSDFDALIKEIEDHFEYESRLP